MCDDAGRERGSPMAGIGGRGREITLRPRRNEHFPDGTHLNVVDDQTVNIQTLVVSVRLGVAQQLEQELGGLLGPTSLGGSPLLGLGASTDSTVEATERNALLVVGHVLQETLSTTQRHMLDGLGSFMGVLFRKLTTNM